MVPYSRPWYDVWVDSAYGPGGFWRSEHPAAHFRTAANTTTRLLAGAITGVLHTNPGLTTVIDVGAGGGELLSSLAEHHAQLGLIGIDLRGPTHGGDSRIGWVEDRWDPRTHRWSRGLADEVFDALTGPSLVVCSEFLDDLPCPVVSRESAYAPWCHVRVAATGREDLGDPVSLADAGWLARWWPTGTRAEVGRNRDEAWAKLLGRLRPQGGLGVMVDYGHLRGGRPPTGTLLGYAGGRVVAPDPQLVMNLTAHVAVDSVVAAGAEVPGAETLALSRLRDVLAGMAAGEPRAAQPTPQDLLADLVRRSEASVLDRAQVWGEQWWLLQRVGGT